MSDSRLVQTAVLGTPDSMDPVFFPPVIKPGYAVLLR